MNSFKIIQEGSSHHSKERFSLKHSLLKEEISKLNKCLTSSALICNTIKSLHSQIGGERETQAEHIQRWKSLLNPLSKQIEQAHSILTKSNLRFEAVMMGQLQQKQQRQQFFLQILKGYQAKMGELEAAIKLMEQSLQYYSRTPQPEAQEQFEEDFSPQFLQVYLNLQKQKQQAIQALQIKPTSSRLISQSSIRSREIIQDPESTCQNILLKEKIVKETLLWRISKLRSQQAAERSIFQRLTTAVKRCNISISEASLQASIVGSNSFLLDNDHYSRHWSNMQKALNARLADGVPPYRRLRSKSCVVMEGSKLEQEVVNVSFQKSLSIEEESLLDNLEYFVSEKFIRDLVGR